MADVPLLAGADLTSVVAGRHLAAVLALAKDDRHSVAVGLALAEGDRLSVAVDLALAEDRLRSVEDARRLVGVA